MTNKKEEEVRIIGPNRNNTQNYYINTSLREELKSVQKAIALLKQDIRKIFREELFRFLLRLNNNEGQQQAIGNRYKQ